MVTMFPFDIVEDAQVAIKNSFRPIEFALGKPIDHSVEKTLDPIVVMVVLKLNGQFEELEMQKKNRWRGQWSVKFRNHKEEVQGSLLTDSKIFQMVLNDTVSQVDWLAYRIGLFDENQGYSDYSRNSKDYARTKDGLRDEIKGLSSNQLVELRKKIKDPTIAKTFDLG